MKKHFSVDFLAGPGEMAERMRAFDWTATQLGPPNAWPAPLRTMVRMALSTKHPVFIFWGREHVCLYNDAYRTSLGPEQHPSMLGRPAKQAWASIWNVIGPQIEQVLRGDGATWHENHLVPLVRHGELQDVYWTYSYAPIDDESAPSGVGGVLVLCNETTQEVVARQRLASEQARLAKLFEQAPTFMAFLRGSEHVFELVNPAYETLVDHRPVLGKRVADALPETVDQGFVAILDEVYRTGKPYLAAAAVYQPPGTKAPQRHLDFVYQPVLDEIGQVTGIFVVGTEITERVMAQMALQRSEEQLRVAVEAGGIGLWDYDPVRDELHWPPIVKAMFGIAADASVTAHDFYAALHPDDESAVKAAYAAAIDPDTRHVYEAEYRTIGRDDGVVRWIAAKGRGIFQAGQCIRVVGSMVDVTKRKTDEQRLRELNDALERRLVEYLAEKKLFADLVDASDAFVQVSDLNFNWLAINKASADEFERIYGKRPEVGLNMLELLSDLPDHQKAVREVWQRALTGEEFTDTQEFGEPGRDRRAYEMRFRPLHDGAGKRIGAYQIVYDVTERLLSQRRLAETEEALHQAQKLEAVGRLTGGLAHDFNNLLQSARNNFEILRMKPEDPAFVAKWAEKGIDLTKRAAKLTTQLLAFSRHQSADLRPLCLREHLAGMCELLRSTLGRSIELIIHEVDAGLWALVDATQLEMAMLNLAVNAKDAMPAGGRFEVAVAAAGDSGPTVRPDDTRCVEIRLSDTGLGMSKDVVTKAFDPFFTTKEVGKGSGLGLSQVYGMATRAGGNATIQSTPGKGTTVIITLLRAEAQETAPGDDPDLQLATSEARGTVLVIDDDDEVRQGLVTALTSLGHRVLDASSGMMGLEVLRREPVDAVLLDFAMPGLNGAQVARLARLDRPQLNIVFMSGYSDADAIAEAVGGNARLLRKPFDMQILRRALQETMRSASGRVAPPPSG